MHPSTTLSSGMDVHHDASAVAEVAQDHGAEVISLGTMGPRRCAIAQLLRKLPSKRTPRVFVDAAGPCGYGR
jgi:methylmalonyl-CoA mutase cobalamin-binding subunit